MNSAYTEIEAAIVDQLIDKIGDDRFDLWFEGDQSFKFDGKSLTVRSREYFAQNRIRQSFVDDLSQVAHVVVGHPVEISFDLLAESTAELNSESSANSQLNVATVSEPVQATGSSRSLQESVETGQHLIRFPGNKVESELEPCKPSRTYQTFALSGFEFGADNGLLQSAIEQTVSAPGQFSPLYLYGPVGCGKTHLLRGMIDAFRSERRMSRCLYMTAEQFTSNFVEALDGRGVSDFRRKCRGLHALAIDDVQFFGGKRATLIEFQSTIESLVREGRQIILAGDCSLAELRCFEPELINRIAGGLPCPVSYADTTARGTIIRNLASRRCMTLDSTIVDYLASNLGKDVRHLSGALNRIQAAELSGQTIQGAEDVHHLVLDLIQASRVTVTIREIESAVGEFCGIAPRDLRSPSRAKSVSTARMLAMFLSRRLTGSAFSEIGHHFGGRSHSTVISANHKIENWMARNHFISVNHTQCNVNEVIDRIESKLCVGQ